MHFRCAVLYSRKCFSSAGKFNFTQETKGRNSDTSHAYGVDLMHTLNRANGRDDLFPLSDKYNAYKGNANKFINQKYKGYKNKMVCLYLK
jgi:hypothetical protein